MSVIGPRPDYVVQAQTFAACVPGYAERFTIKPGITGYAQVRLGYAGGPELTVRKTRLDHVYIRNACWRVDTAIVWWTLLVMSTGFGARSGAGHVGPGSYRSSPPGSCIPNGAVVPADLSACLQSVGTEKKL